MTLQGQPSFMQSGAAFLGPRIGKYNSDGSPNALPVHNMSIATLGALILWLGWFGFNPGSTMGVGNGSLIAHIALTTNTAGAFGALASHNHRLGSVGQT